jgi:hypothetical protein
MLFRRSVRTTLTAGTTGTLAVPSETALWEQADNGQTSATDNMASSPWRFDECSFDERISLPLRLGLGPDT